MRFDYAAFILKNASPLDPDWDTAISMAVDLLEKEARKCDDALEVEYEEINECN